MRHVDGYGVRDVVPVGVGHDGCPIVDHVLSIIICVADALEVKAVLRVDPQYRELLVRTCVG